jgi:hypothetical protein
LTSDERSNFWRKVTKA